MGRVPRWTLPHLRVNVEGEIVEEMENPCPTGKDHYNLCDSDWVWERFKEDPTVRAMAAQKADIPITDDLVHWVADGFGFSPDAFQDLEPEARIEKMHREAALFATRCVVEMAEAFAAEHQSKLLVLLSFGNWHVKQALLNQPLFDQTFLDWLAKRDTLVVDLRDAFREDFAKSKLDVDAYLAPFYNGHHTPRGNFFFAWAIKQDMANWLDPKPLPYRF